MVGAKGCFADLRASPALLVTIVPNAACPQPLPGPTPTRARGYDRLALGIVEPSREASFSVQCGYSKSPQAINPGALIFRIFLVFCRYFMSGGTRTRTGDTMIFSLGRYVSARCP